MDEIFEANENQNIIMSKTHKRIQRFTNGAGWLPAIEMMEGEELEIVVEFTIEASEHDERATDEDS